MGNVQRLSPASRARVRSCCVCVFVLYCVLVCCVACIRRRSTKSENGSRRLRERDNRMVCCGHRRYVWAELSLCKCNCSWATTMGQMVIGAVNRNCKGVNEYGSRQSNHKTNKNKPNTRRIHIDTYSHTTIPASERYTIQIAMPTRIRSTIYCIVKISQISLGHIRCE